MHHVPLKSCTSNIQHPVCSDTFTDFLMLYYGEKVSERCSINWVLKIENKKLVLFGVLLEKKSKASPQFLNIIGFFHSLVRFLIEVHGFDDTGYMVSSSGTSWLSWYGYLVSRVQDT